MDQWLNGLNPSISSSYTVIIGVRVVLKRTVVGDQLPEGLISFSAVQIYDLSCH